MAFDVSSSGGGQGGGGQVAIMLQINSWNLTQSMTSKGTKDLIICRVVNGSNYHLTRDCYQAKEKSEILIIQGCRMSQLHFWISKMIEFNF